jgi:predicted SprT family Zn-dependent metalloprotease
LINENKPKEHWLIIESHELAHYRLYKYGNPEWKSHSKAFFKEYKDLLVNYVKLSKSDFLWTYYNTEYNKYVLNKK